MSGVVPYGVTLYKIMVRGQYRSRTFRRIKKTTPGAKNKIHYVKRKHAKAQCGVCGRALPGVATGPASKMKNMPKTAKRPQRPFGGVLCTKCSRAKIKKDN